MLGMLGGLGLLGIILLAGLAFLVFLILIFVFIYNSLVSLRNNIDGAWAQIDVQLKKRYDLIPNLVETVKGYAKHEKSVFTDVTKARAAMANATTVKEKGDASNMLTNTLKSLFAVAENYPQLRANENFKMLQEELSGVESKIAYSRQFYNDNVLEFNKKIQTIPYNLLAGPLGFTKRDYFGIAEEERKAVKVSFKE